MLAKITMPLSSIANAILAMDSSALDIDQVENLIRFCPNEEEIEMLKNFNGDKEVLGKCEQLFLELMKVPRVRSKLRVFAFTMTFPSQVEDLKFKLNSVNNFAKEIRGCMKLRFILKTLVSLGNPFKPGNTPTVAQRIKLKHIEPSTPERIAFMHHIRTILAQKKPELLEFSKDLVHLGPASEVQLKDVAGDMYAIHKGLENVEYEATSAKNNGVRKVLMSFLDMAQAEVNLLRTLWSIVGRNADALTTYFLDDPATYPVEEVIRVFLVITNILAR